MIGARTARGALRLWWPDLVLIVGVAAMSFHVVAANY